MIYYTIEITDVMVDSFIGYGVVSAVSMVFIMLFIATCAAFYEKEWKHHNLCKTIFVNIGVFTVYLSVLIMVAKSISLYFGE